MQLQYAVHIVRKNDLYSLIIIPISEPAELCDQAVSSSKSSKRCWWLCQVFLMASTDWVAPSGPSGPE